MKPPNIHKIYANIKLFAILLALLLFIIRLHCVTFVPYPWVSSFELLEVLCPILFVFNVANKCKHIVLILYIAAFTFIIFHHAGR